jgi:hypothetical protein
VVTAPGCSQSPPGVVAADFLQFHLDQYGSSRVQQLMLQNQSSKSYLLTLAFAASLVTFASPASAQSHALPRAHQVSTAVRYSCSATEELSVQRDGSTARVSLGGRSYDLQRKRSSIGDKYLSSAAALIIDGPSATFITQDRLDLGSCVEVVPVANAH